MKVIGYGDNVVDRYVNKKIMFPGGNAVNFAVYAKESGMDASLLLNFADDAEADHIIWSMKDLGIHLTGCRREFGATTERCDVNLVNGDRVFIEDDYRETKAAPPLLTEKDLKYLDGFALIHSGCYAGVESEIAKLKDKKAVVTFDFSVEPEFKEDEYLRQICPYIDMALFSCEGMNADEIRALQEKVHAMGTKYILTTKGTEGQTLYDGKDYYTGIVELVEAVDTMGAGDSFFTSFVCTLLKEGWTKETTLTKEMIDKAFHTAARFSANNCLREGAFGYAKAIAEKKASKILISKHIFTALEEAPVSGAVVISDNKITAVTTKEKAMEYKGEDTAVYDLGEQLICPGFVDNHVFFTGYVWSHVGADLSRATTKKEAAQILLEYAKNVPEGRSVLGHGLSGEVAESDEDAEEVLKAFGNVPVVGFTADRDGCIMNQAARERFGFDENEVYAEACWKVFDEYLRDEDFIKEEYEKFSALLAERGITAIKEIGFDSYSGFTRLLKQMEEQNTLKHRVHLVSQPVGREMDYDYAKECRDLFQGDFIQFMGYNVMVDGEIATNNADVIDAYKNLPGSHGEQEIDYPALEEMTIKADALGLRCALHAEGDQAARKTIDIYEKCRKVNGIRDSRHVITDLEMVRPEDLKRMADLGITACNYVQIIECLGDYEDFYGYDRVGEEGIKNYWPYKRMLESGVHAVCGTDLPLTVPDIPLSAYLTVNRTFPDGKPEGGINKECALTVGEILTAWTKEGQYANFKEDVLGTLEAGKLADIAVIDQNLFEMESEKLKEAKVSMTICDGKIVYQKN